MKPFTESKLPRLFVDTWAWIALSDVRDAAHEQVRGVRQQYADRRGVWVTTDYVLDELISRLFSRGHFDEAVSFCDSIFAAEKEARLVLEPITPARFQSAYRLRLRYRDKPGISFTDFTSFAVMRELGIRDVMTGDAHFKQVRLGFRTVP